MLACSALKRSYRDLLMGGATRREHVGASGALVRAPAGCCNAFDERQWCATTGAATSCNESSYHHDVVVVYLNVSPNDLLSRLSLRSDHFMPAALLDSQLATLQEPVNDWRHLVVDIDGETSVQTILAKIKAYFRFK